MLMLMEMMFIQIRRIQIALRATQTLDVLMFLKKTFICRLV